jgi:hypothetical protein
MIVPQNDAQSSQGQGDLATWWAHQHPDVSIEAAYRAGGQDAQQALLSGLQSARAADATRLTWQPIKTAPKDGSVIDVWLGEADDDEAAFYCTPGTRRSCGWLYRSERFRPAMGLPLPVVTVRPTHWMPLPNPPKAVDDQTVEGRLDEPTEGPEEKRQLDEAFQALVSYKSDPDTEEDAHLTAIRQRVETVRAICGGDWQRSTASCSLADLAYVLALYDALTKERT